MEKDDAKLRKCRFSGFNDIARSKSDTFLPAVNFQLLTQPFKEKFDRAAMDIENFTFKWLFEEIFTNVSSMKYHRRLRC